MAALRRCSAVGGHAAQPAHQAFQAFHFLAADVDVVRRQRPAPGPAEQAAEEVERVANLVRDLGGHGLHQRLALAAPGRRLLLAPLLQLLVGAGVGQGQRALVDHGAEQIQIVAGEQGAAGLGAHLEHAQAFRAEHHRQREIGALAGHRRVRGYLTGALFARRSRNGRPALGVRPCRLGSAPAGCARRAASAGPCARWPGRPRPAR